jgi:hypothetical protein
MKYTADFETTTDPDDCRVWAWGLCRIDTPDLFISGNNIDDFMAEMSDTSHQVYFHNLKFDGEFILSWLFRNGFEYTEKRDDLFTGSFCTMISDTGQWYSITICFKRQMKRSVYLSIYDSLKILPFTVEQVARSFGLPIKKGTIDYTKYREPGHILTDDELDYLKNDVKIMAMALQQLFAEELKSMTTGSNALKDFKRIFGKDQFRDIFPVPEYDTDIRKSYRGGFTWLKPGYRNKTIGSGMVFDVNSLYPYVMDSCLMPYGSGIYFDGKYQTDELYPLYIQMITCQFKLKKRHIPTIQLKKNRYFYGAGEYLENSNGQDIALTLTSVDLKLFREHYQVTDISFIGGYKFKAAAGLFSEYIAKWKTVKDQAKQTGNKGQYTLAKLMLNSLYGKFALNPEMKMKMCSYDPDADMVQLTAGQPEQRSPVYIPVGTFITAYARAYTIRAAQKLYKRFVYADTDSLHIIGTEMPDLDIDPVRLGAWKHELTFSKAHYIRPKTYIELGHEPGSGQPDQLKVTVAGLPDRCHDQVTFDNFRPGTVYHDKLLPKRVPGGVVLLQTDYRIKEL